MNKRISEGTVQERHFKALMFEPQSRGVTAPLMQAYAKQLGNCLDNLWQNRKLTIKTPKALRAYRHNRIWQYHNLRRKLTN
jgi:hypothetical protein